MVLFIGWIVKKMTEFTPNDIETEKIKSLPAPPGLETPSSCLRLAELGNCLCLTDHIEKQRVLWNSEVKRMLTMQ